MFLYFVEVWKNPNVMVIMARCFPYGLAYLIVWIKKFHRFVSAWNILAMILMKSHHGWNVPIIVNFIIIQKVWARIHILMTIFSRASWLQTVISDYYLEMLWPKNLRLSQLSDLCSAEHMPSPSIGMFTNGSFTSTDVSS